MNGLWGHGCEHTLSHQAVRLGVPAFQLELPFSLRRAAMQDDGAIVKKLAAAIVAIYNNVVTQIQSTKGRVQDHSELPLVPHKSPHREDGAMQFLVGADAWDIRLDAEAAMVDEMLRDVAVLDARDKDRQI